MKPSSAVEYVLSTSLVKTNFLQHHSKILLLLPFAALVRDFDGSKHFTSCFQNTLDDANVAEAALMTQMVPQCPQAREDC